METKYYVYALINPVTNMPFYIGKGLNKRAYNHLKETRKNTENYKKWLYIERLRNEGFEPIVKKLIENLDEDLAYNEEEKLIQFYGRMDIDENGILVNICNDVRPPNMKGRAWNDEVKCKIGNANKNRVYINKNGICKRPKEDTLHKYLSEGWKLGKNYNHSEETKRKISESNKSSTKKRCNYNHSEETKRKIGESNKNAWNDENRKKQGVVRKNYLKNHPEAVENFHILSRIKNLGSKWIKKNNKSIRISYIDLEKYLNDGWVLGRILKKNKKH